MITLEPIASLSVSAASGLVRVGDTLCVVADDELGLVRFDLGGAVAAAPLRLFAGELPDEHVARKRAKPDLEALVLLGTHHLLALGSGSRDNRKRGASIVGDEVREVELAGLYDGIAAGFDRLNIEGASVLGDELVLLTRRTGNTGRNTMVRLDLRRTLAALARDRPMLDVDLLLGVTEVELGDVDGAPYGFTDATPDGDGLLFTAAAEDTDDPFDDGACRGCMIGRLDAEGRVLARWPVVPTLKLEGITSLDQDHALVVADADDPRVSSPLLRARIPGRGPARARAPHR